MTLGSINCKFCASKLLLFVRISWYSYNLPSPLILYSFCLSGAHRIIFFSLLSVTNHYYLVAMYLEKRPHDLSGSTQCLRIPCFLCLHPINYFPHPIYCSKCLLVFLPVKLYLSGMVCHWLPFKSFFLSSLNNGAKLYPKLALQTIS